MQILQLEEGCLFYACHISGSNYLVGSELLSSLLFNSRDWSVRRRREQYDLKAKGCSKKLTNGKHNFNENGDIVVVIRFSL